MEIVVVGAGIAGLGAGLALSGPGRNVKIIERDPSPPIVPMDEVFDSWERKGVTHLRHSHAFIPKLFNLIRDNYPDLLQALIEAGAREVTFGEVLEPDVRKGYRSAPGDADMSMLTSRRTTLEYVMRAYAEKRPGVGFVSQTLMRGLLVEKDMDGIHTVKGIVVEKADGSREAMRADVVIDASGRNTIFPDCLAEHGIAPETEEAPVGIVYYTRHYRLRPGQTEPAGSNFGADLDYIKYMVFPADLRNFSVTLQVPEIETTLRERIMHPEIFDRMSAAFTGSAPWTDPARSVPTSKIFGMGNLKNIWRHWIKDGRPLVKNFFAIGDATISTNPAYGRGCSFGMVQAHLLADVLRTTADPLVRAKAFESKTKRELRPFYDSMVRQDLMGIKRAEQARDPAYRPNFAARLMKSFIEDAVMPAMRGDIPIRRAIFRGASMLESPNAWMKRPDVLGRLLWIWAKPKRAKQHLYAGPRGPDRAGLLALIK